MGHLCEDGLNFEGDYLKKEAKSTSIQNDVKVLLLGLGEDVNREGIIKTPLRVAKALIEGTRGYTQSANEIVEDALFPEAGAKVGHAGGVGGLVIVRGLDFYSYCESCMLPFYFKCHVGYVPSGQRVLGLSKLSRVTNVFAKRFQEPQRLAKEVSSALHQGIQPEGVAVILQCTHINIPNSKHKGFEEIYVSSGSGVFENKDADTWRDFFGLLNISGIDHKDKFHIKGSFDQHWCPSLSSKVPSQIGEINPNMVTAVSSILKSLGEDPTRKELLETPSRYVKWLINFQCSEFNVKLLNGSLKVGRDDSFSTSTKEVISFNEKRLHSELNLPFLSQCEHHLLPFHGVAHIGYLNSKGFDPIEKSILQSIVYFYGVKLQVQERLTKQIAETLSPLVGGNVIVVVEASHTCMMSRGIEKFGSSTTTIAALGHFSTDLAARTTFLKSIPNTTSL